MGSVKFNLYIIEILANDENLLKSAFYNKIMEENPVKMVPLGGYSKDLREKAIEMHVSGYSKTRIAQILGVGRTTIRRWLRCGINPYFKPYPTEIKQKAIDLVKSGMNRIEVAARLRISYFTISFWTRGLNQHKYLPQPYSRKLKRKARKLVRTGLAKIETAAKLNIPYTVVAAWTNDVHNPGAHLSGAAEKIISVLINEGYFFPKSGQLGTCRSLRERLQVKMTRIRNVWICYLPGNEQKAMKAILEKLHYNLISNQKLSGIRTLFGF